MIGGIGGGIDSQVRQAMLSAGNDAGVLEEEYRKRRRLIDLLALQQLKSEKESAARDIQMKMQQQPQTIMEQREQELMGMTRQEMMQKMGPTLARTGQESAQQAAQQGQMGIASQAPPQMGMKEGGLVPGYADGGMTLTNNPATDTLIGKNLDEALALLKKGMPLEAVMKLFPNLDRRMLEAATGIKEAGEKAGAIGSTAAGVAAIPKIGGGLMEDLYERAKVLPEGMAEHVLKPAIEGFTGNYAVDREASKPNQEQPDQLKPIYPQRGKLLTPSGIAGLGNNINSSGGSSSSGSTYDPALTDLEKASDKYVMDAMSADPAAEADKARARVEGILAPLLAKQKEGEAITLQQRMLNEKLNSPENQRFNSLVATLTNMAGKNGRGNALAGAARGSMRQNAINNKALQDMLATHKASGQIDYSNLQGITDTIAKADSTAYEGTEERAGKAANTAALSSANRRTAMVSAENARIAAEANRLYRQGQIDLKTYQNIDAIERRNLAIMKEFEDAKQNDATYQAIQVRLSMLDPEKKPGDYNREMRNLKVVEDRIAQQLGIEEAVQKNNNLLRSLYKQQGLDMGFLENGKSDDGFSATRID